MEKNNLNDTNQPKISTNPIQKMNDHSDLAKGLLNGPQARQRKNQLWVNLKNILNSNGPPTKSEADWKKVWQDHKWSVKRKFQHNKGELKKTGGGPCQLKEISVDDDLISRAAGLEATVNGLNSSRFGANVNIMQENITPLSTENVNLLPSEEPNYNNDVGNNSSLPNLNKVELLQKSLAVNENLLNSFSRIEDHLKKLQEQNVTIIELKKQKLALLKESNNLKRQQIFAQRSRDSESCY